VTANPITWRHTWPERGMVTLDAYVCNLGRDNASAAHTLVEALVKAFSPASADRQQWSRGRYAYARGPD